MRKCKAQRRAKRTMRNKVDKKDQLKGAKLEIRLYKVKPNLAFKPHWPCNPLQPLP